MIKLKKDGQYFDVLPIETVTTEWVSTLFNDDAEFNGSYTYPVRAPFSPRNNKLLKGANLIENRSARYSTDVTIEIFGRDWKKAKLTFDVTREGYDMYCLIDNAEFANEIKDKLLPEVFAIYAQGVFSDFIYDRLGSSRQETLNTMLDRANIPGAGPCVFVSQKNDNLFGDAEGDGALGYDDDYRINIYHGGSTFMGYVLNPGNDRKVFYNPSFYLTWVVKQVCSYLGFTATGDMFTDEALKSLVIDNTGMLDVATIFALDGGKIAISRHLPNIKIADFFKMIRATFKLAIYFDGNERKAYFNYAPNMIKATSGVDISGYTEPGYVIKSYVPTGYQLVQPADEDDALFKTFEYIKTWYVGDNKEPKKQDSYIGTSFMTDINEPRPVDGGTWRIARKRQVGNVYSPKAANTEAFNETGYGRNDFAFRLLNYRGVKYGSNGQPYYYASSDGRNPDATEEPGALALWLGGSLGLINRFLKDWLLYVLRTEEVEIIAHVPAHVMLQLSPIKKLLWTTDTRALIPAMISQVSFEHTSRYANKVSAKIKVFPIYNQAATDLKTFTEITPGEVENQGKIYVKFRLVEVGRDVKTYWGSLTITKAIYSAGYLDFFSDEACTKPRAVTNLPVNMIYNYRGANERNYVIDMPFQVKASGTSYQIQVNQEIGIYQTYRYESGSDYWTKTYALTSGPDYVVK